MLENSILPEAIKSKLRTRFIGQRLIYYPSLTSTNDEAKREARQGAAEGTVIIAGEQTAGKGRIKRIWLSPEGSLAISVILYPSMVHLSSLIMLASLAVVFSIKAVTGLMPQIKWPNDILLNGRKVSGILIESEMRGSRVNYSIIGIGVNVNFRASGYPDIASIATSLSEEMGREVSLTDLVQQLLAEIERLYLALREGESLYEDWRDSLVTLGRRVQVTSGDSIYEGIAESVARDGALLLRQPGGQLTRIVAEDVTLRN